MTPGSCFAWLEGQDCEHVAFNAGLRTGLRATRAAADDDDGLRLAVVPSLLNCLASDDAGGGGVGAGAGAGGANNNRNPCTVVVNPDGSYTAGIHGVVQYTRAAQSPQAGLSGS